MKKLLALALLALSFAAHAVVGPALPLDQCKVQAPYGFPTSQKTSVTKVCRTGYVLEHNNVAHIPTWVSYVLTPEHATGCFPRVARFVPEPSLPAGASATNKQYAKSGFDIGHMANDSDMRWSVQTEEESNLFANAAPQLPEFNRGIWKKLEDGTRGWALSRKHPILVYIAPAVDKTDQFMPNTDVPVPHGFVKIEIDTVTQDVQILYFKHEGSKANLNTFITTLPDAQQKTGVVFPMPPKPKFTKLWPVSLKSARAAKSQACPL
jgi:endonuclease G